MKESFLLGKQCQGPPSQALSTYVESIRGNSGGWWQEEGARPEPVIHSSHYRSREESLISPWPDGAGSQFLRVSRFCNNLYLTGELRNWNQLIKMLTEYQAFCLFVLCFSRPGYSFSWNCWGFPFIPIPALAQTPTSPLNPGFLVPAYFHKPTHQLVFPLRFKLANQVHCKSMPIFQNLSP